MASHSPRVDELLSSLTLREKLAQLVGLWAAAKRKDENVAPMQDQLLADTVNFERFAADGLGQFTRHYGTRPIEANAGAAELERRQRWLIGQSRFGIPAVVHEECLTGVLAAGATGYPTPLAWGATFNPPLVRRLGEHIGADLRSLGVHQGLAPVLDVIRDARWGRVEECIAEDPYVVGAIGAAYVAGIESTGRVATLKHFVGYSNSRGGQNHGPVAMGRRELAEVFLPPFHQAIRDGGARSVMNSYTEIDGIPVAADRDLLTGVLRDDWGFEGTVVADYFAVTFLQTMHGVAADLGEAAVAAITAGIDVELPTGSAYLAPLEAAVEAGTIDLAVVDAAVARVLTQKEQLGLLAADYNPAAEPDIDLDSASNRAVARELAEQSIVLLANTGILPLARAAGQRVAIIGPNAFSTTGLFGCYSFVNHVLPHHPDYPTPATLTVAEALRQELRDASIVEARGCDILSEETDGIAEAVAAAAGAEVALVVVGDQSGMFGRGTSGEGCDSADLSLPGAQQQLVEAILATGTPTVLVLVTGRPYVLGALAERAAAVIQAFLPGQEGAAAIARVITGAVVPSGRLPVSFPTAVSTQPSSYLHPVLGGRTAVSSADPTPAFPFGFGLSYTEFEYGELELSESGIPTTGRVVLGFDLTNIGGRDAEEVVQVYANDPVASVTRPVRALVAFGRVAVAAGRTVRVRVELSSAVFSLVNRRFERVVEPGTIELIVARNAADPGRSAQLELVGDTVPAELAGTEDRVLSFL